MEHIKQQIDTSLYMPAALGEYLEGLTIGFLDIETTGLSPIHSQFILGGALFPEKDRLSMVQYLAENYDEEKVLLQIYANLLSNTDVLITYNGHRFDIPFLHNRFRFNGMTSPLTCYQSLDLYRVCNLYSPFRQFLPDLKQKTIEGFLGISGKRTDEITGQQSVKLYKEYLKTGASVLKDRILLHNSDDLFQLSRLLRVTEKLDIHKILFNEGFTVARNNMRCFIRSISLKGNSLNIGGSIKNMPFDYHAYTESFKAIFDIKNDTFTLNLPCRHEIGRLFVDVSHLPLNHSPLTPLEGFQSGYLILYDQWPRYHEMNILAREILRTIMDDMI
ncbi:MAG: ribonuclease H-like domain-containing protein [Anaerovoracaceae bacterium]|jgi:uncharacterized protein YprB with RNaseH-like and TPR domain